MCVQDRIYSGSVALAVQKKEKKSILGFSEVSSCVSPFTTVEVTALGLLSNHTVVIFMVVKVAEDRDNPSFTEYV